MKLKGSSLIFSLVVLSFLLVSALSVAVVSITARRSSLSSKNSNIAFQVADSATEAMLKQIYKGSNMTLNDLASSLGTGCSGSLIGRGFAGAGTYTATLQKKDGSSITCEDSSWRDIVSKIKFLGTFQSTTRAIEVGITPPCNPVDDKDGNTYDTVLIGTQCWMKENLMTTQYSDSTSVTRGPTATTWNGSDNAFYAYPPASGNGSEDSLANIKTNKLGFVYQWSAAMNGSTSEKAQGICPANWHIPTDAEWFILENYLKDTGQPCNSSRTSWDCSTAGTKLKTGGTSGFEVMLAGSRGSNGSFSGRNTSGVFWSSTQSGSLAWERDVSDSNVTVSRNTNLKANAYAVRCLKN